jgi:hypothetical protein
MAAAPSLSAFAQTNAAAMAVRQQVEGLRGVPGSPEGPPGSSQPHGIPGQPGSPEMAAGKLDTRFISPAATAVLVIRPSQLLASPIAQMFPVEVASAASQKHLGFDTAEMDEVTAFFENPMMPQYGVTFKFKNQIRATSIPVEMRSHVQLAELGGKKYLKSVNPMMWSLYGPNNKTLVVASDAKLQQMVQSAARPPSGPMLDRIREVPSGSDFYLAVDMTQLRPFIQMGLQQAKVPPEAKPYVELVNLISAVELTLNASTPGPTSLVVHCNDDAAAQKFESAIQEAMQKARAAQQTEQPGGQSPFAQALAQYQDRITQPFQPQRNGTSVTWIHLDGQNPAHKEMLAVGLGFVVGTLMTPAIQAARKAAQAQAARNAGGPPGSPEAPGAPVSPEGESHR